MSRFTRRAAVALTAAAVAFAPVSIAQAQNVKDVRDTIKVANQGLEVAGQSLNLLNQLSSTSSKATPSTGNGNTPKPDTDTPAPSAPVSEELLINVKGHTTNLTNNRQVVMGGVPYPHSSVSPGYPDPTFTLNKRDIVPYTTFKATLGFDDNLKQSAAYGIAEVWENGKLVRTVRFNHDETLPFTHTFAQGTEFSIVLHAFRADHTEMRTHGMALGTPTLS